MAKSKSNKIVNDKIEETIEKENNIVEDIIDETIDAKDNTIDIPKNEYEVVLATKTYFIIDKNGVNEVINETNEYKKGDMVEI